MQTTIKSAVGFSGVGLHSGAPARATIHPASAEYGIWFRRTDADGADALIPAHWAASERAELCTRLAGGGASVSTVEHILAALVGCGVHNALIEVDGPEIPIMDGSALPFARAIVAQGLRRLAAPVRAIEVLRPVEVRHGAALARLEPAPAQAMGTLSIDFEIDFPDAAIGYQRKALTLSNGTFLRELSDCRTFCRRAEIEAMHARGLARGGSYANAVVVDGDAVLSPGGLRRPDEAVRHKMLDALGDLALAGAPILGRYKAVRAGHRMTGEVLRALFASPGAARMVTCRGEGARLLPGAGVHRGDLPIAA